MLDAVIKFLLSPLDVPAITGLNEQEEEEQRIASDDESFSALAFKIATDLYNVNFFRVYSGIMGQQTEPCKGKKERWEEFYKCIQIVETKSKK